MRIWKPPENAVGASAALFLSNALKILALASAISSGWLPKTYADSIDILDTSYIRRVYYDLSFGTSTRLPIRAGSERIFLCQQNSQAVNSNSIQLTADDLAVAASSFTGMFNQLSVGTDYTIDYINGILTFKTNLQPQFVVAVDFVDAAGNHLVNETGAAFTGGTGLFKLIKTSADIPINVSAATEVGFNRELKTVYAIGQPIVRDNGTGNFSLQVINPQTRVEVGSSLNPVQKYSDTIQVNFENGTFRLLNPFSISNSSPATPDPDIYSPTPITKRAISVAFAPASSTLGSDGAASVLAQQWRIASNPTQGPADPQVITWFNEDFFTHVIDPAAPGGAYDTQKVLDVTYNFGVNGSTEASIVYVFSPTGLNFSQRTYLQAVMLGDASNNEINFHLGSVNEDADGTGGATLNCSVTVKLHAPKTEDTDCDGVLQPSEDVGWTYAPIGKNSTNYGAGNGKIDSEDLNQNGILDADDGAGDDYGYNAATGTTHNLLFDQTTTSTRTRIDFSGSQWHTFNLPLGISTATIQRWNAIKELRISIRQRLGGASSGTLKFASIVVTSSAAAAAVGSQGSALYLSPVTGPITLSIPANSFSQGVSVSLSTPTSFLAYGAPSTSASSQLTGTGLGVQVDVNPPVQPTLPCTLSVSYAHIDFSQLNPAQLILARFDTTRNTWVPLPSSVDSTKSVITAKTGHLSLFQVMASTPATTLSGIKAFPNPLRPSQGQSSMTFSSLPAGSRIRIYNLKGNLIKDLTSDGAGLASWDATNQSGAAVASGVYFAFVQGSGQSETVKVVIQK